MEKSCARHVIKCRCILTQFKRMADPPVYEFVAFSEIIDGVVQTKLSACPNCGTIHKVIDICKSEILNRDDSRTMTSIEDIRVSLSEPLAAILEKHAVDISVWEHARWIIEQQSWGSFITLEQEKISGGKNIKIMIILGNSLFRIETKFVTEVI